MLTKDQVEQLNDEFITFGGFIYVYENGIIKVKGKYTPEQLLAIYLKVQGKIQENQHND